jgi:hypothetical protein
MRSWLSVFFAWEWPIGGSPGLDSKDDVRHPQRQIRMMIVISVRLPGTQRRSP